MNSSMQPHYAMNPERKPARRTQVADSSVPGGGISELQIRRIVAALEAGTCERKIAESERIPERYVRRVRQLHIDRLHRRMSAVGTAFGGMMENLKHMHGEIDLQAFEELTEGAA